MQQYEAYAPAVTPLELEVTAGPAAGQRLSVHEDFRVGSAEPGPATLGGDRWLSVSHALFHRGPDGWAVEDLRSLEGTKLNGRALHGAATLAAGDVVELGSSRIVVLPDASTSATALVQESPAGMAATRREESRRELDGRRLLAVLIDSLVLAVPSVYIAIELGRSRAVFWLGAIALSLTYYFLCESLTGQTLGKRITGLRVVRIDGRPLTPSAVAARTVLRLVDQQLACLVGMLTMILTGKRRQRLGDLAARTAVTRASAPAPRPERRGRERFALWAYPCVWLAPAILLFALVPDTRLLSCKDAGISAETGQEGSCLMSDGHGGEGVLQAVNIGHTLRLPRYSVRVLGTGAQQAPTRLLGARYYRNGSTVVVGFKLAVENTGNAPLRFATYSHQVLGVPRPDGLGMAAVRELPRAAHSGFRSFAEAGPIAPGRTKVAWASFGVPPDAVPMLRQPIAGLALIPKADSGGLAHVGEIRLYRAATPAGAQALAGLRY